MIVAMAGSPGTGKSTLARTLSEALDGLLLDKDALGAQLFPYGDGTCREQNDWTDQVALTALAWNLQKVPERVVVLDGHRLTRTEEVHALRRFAIGLGHPLQIVECVCPAHIARARLGTRPPTPARGSVGGDPSERLPPPKIVADTTLPPDRCLDLVLRQLPPATRAMPSNGADPPHRDSTPVPEQPRPSTRRNTATTDSPRLRELR
ncbi:AAA family ATPase [Embleya sp. NPDC059237]|uniref:AAA family ATPase n=1 Tax=Embleya sp. NPDC059237 TaxID=3346784 RepID=UPI00369B87AD